MLAISHKLLCIRLSSLLCCEPRLPRTSGEAVTQGGPLPPLRPPRRPSVTSEAADQEGFPLYPSPRLSEELLGLLLLDFEPFPPGKGGKEGRGKGSTPCLRYLARIPAYNYTALRLCISFQFFTFLFSSLGEEFLDLESRRKNEGIARLIN